MKKDTSQQPSAKINWSKVGGKVASGARVVFEPVMPATVNTIVNTTGAVRDARAAVRSLRTRTMRDQANMQNSRENKNALNLFKSAMDDIQDGSFSLDKVTDELFGDYDTEVADSFNMPRGDEAAEMSSEEIILAGNKGIAKSVVSTGSAQLRGMQATSRAIINSNVKVTKALGATINNTLHFGFNGLNTTLTITNKKLDTINNNLLNMLSFHNQNTIEFYSQSLEMMNGLGRMMENLEKMYNPQERKKRVFDTNMGFDPKEYLKYVKEGITESLFGAVGSGLGGTRGFQRGSGRGGGGGDGIVGMIMSMLLPENLTKPLENFDKSVSRFFDEALRKFADMMDKNEFLKSFGLDGSVFGNKREKINSIKLGKYMKDALPWNGMAQKALVEVIPEYLASIDAKLGNTDKRYYDYNTGKFDTQKNIEKKFQDEYQDRLSFALMDAMEQLKKMTSNSGRPQQDQESFMREIQGLIDDQISGKLDTKSARYEMSRKSRDFGVERLDFEEFVREFQDSLEAGISQVNDMFHDISTTQSVYRNINNQTGSEAAKKLAERHKNRGMTYTKFSKVPDPVTKIKELQRKANITDIDLSTDSDVVGIVLSMAFDDANDAELTSVLSKIYRSKKLQQAFGGRVETRTERLGSAINKVTRQTESLLHRPVYGRSAYDDGLYGPPLPPGFVDQTQGANPADPLIEQVTGQPPRRAGRRERRAARRERRRAASTRMSRNQAGGVSSEEERAVEFTNEIAQRGYDQVLGQSETENDRDQLQLKKSIQTLNEAPPATTVEDSIVQSNNMVRAALGAIVSSFHGFTSRLFGKEGFFRKMWDSDARKKVTDKLKEKLFTGENALLKEPYEKVRAGAKSLKDKTLGYLGKGYDFLYDNTMQYMYNETDKDGNVIGYKDNENWKNNAVFSQTLNREWRAEQKKKREEEAALKSSVNEPSAYDEVEGTPAGETSVSLAGMKNPNTKKSKKNRKARRAEKSSTNTPEVKEATAKIKSSINQAADNVEIAAENLEKSMDALTETVVGDPKISPNEKKRAFGSEFFKKLKATAPKALAGAIAGAGVGLLNNHFSLLGSMFLPGGPIAGAIVGGGLTILTQTEAFKTFMFGKQDPQTQKREGGLINEKMRQKFKQMMPLAIGGAVLGAAKGLLKGALGFNGGLGVMGMQILPGGILGGAILGAGLGILKNSEGFKEMLFGKKDEDGKRSGKFLSDGFNKAGEKFKGMMPKFGKAAAGAGIGALTGAVLSNMGYIPAMFSMGGPVGMGVLGLGLGIASSTKKFNEWMFGSEELDEDGNPTGGRRKDGMLTRVTNLLNANVIEPISTAFKTKMLDLVDWTKDKITYPFRLAFGPILDSLLGIKDNVVDFVKDKFDAIGNGIMDMLKSTMKTLFSPVTKIIGFVGKSMLGIASAGAKIAMSPISIGLQAMQALTAGKRRGEYIDFYKEYYKKGNIAGNLSEMWDAKAKAGQKRNIFGKISDVAGALTGQGEIADAAREGWNKRYQEEGRDHLLWREVPQERRELRANRKKRKASDKQWEKIDAYRRNIINDDLNGREVTLNDYQLKEYKKKFGKLGLDTTNLNTSDDIMELLYRKDSFMKKIDPNRKGEGIVVEETPAQKKAREQTEIYQHRIDNLLTEISVHFEVVADRFLAKKDTKSAKKEFKDAKKKLGKRVKLKKLENVDLSNPELQDFDINELNSDMLDDYKYSSFYNSGDLIGFMKSKNLTQKSAFKVNGTGSPTSGVSKEDPLESIKENLENIGELVNDQKNIQGAQVELMTDGKLDANSIKKKKGKSFGSRIAGLFNPITKLLRAKEKEEAEEQEEQESEEARSGASSRATTVTGKKKKGEKESTNPFSAIWNKIKSIGKMIAGTTVGGFLLKAVKFGGSLGALGAIGFTIAELIRPGTAQKVGAAIDRFNNDVSDGTFDFKDAIENFKQKAIEFGGVIVDQAKNLGSIILTKLGPVGDWLQNTVGPFIGGLGEFVIHNLPTMAASFATLVADNTELIIESFVTVVEALAGPLIEAMVRTLPTLMVEAVKGLGRGTAAVVEDAAAAVFNSTKTTDTKTGITQEQAAENFKKTGARSRVNVNSTKKKEVTVEEAKEEVGSTGVLQTCKAIQNAATGQWYIYDANSAESRKYLDNETAEVFAADPNTQGQLWYDPKEEAFFVEEATYTQYADNIYITDDGKAKSVGRVGSVNTLAKLGVSMATKKAMTGSTLPKIFGTIGKGIGKAGTAIKTGTSAGAKAVRWSGSAAGSLLKGAGKMTSALGSAMKFVGKIPIIGVPARIAGSAVKLTGKAAEAAGTGVKQLFGVSAKSAAKATDAALDATSEGFVAKILTKITTVLKGLTKNKTLLGILEKAKGALTFNASDLLAKVSTWFDDLAKANLGNAKGKAAREIADAAAAKVGTSLATSIPVVTLVAAGWGVVNGALSAANLFEVPEDKVDRKMKLISALMEGLLSISIGCWIDLICMAVEIVSGGKIDVKHDFAVMLYKLLSAGDVESIEKMYDSQEALSAEAELYNALNGTDLSTKSYNDKANKGALTKVINSVAGIFKSPEQKFLENDAYSAYTKVLTEAGISSEQISQMQPADVIAAVKTNLDSSSLSDTEKQNVSKTIDSFGGAQGYGSMTSKITSNLSQSAKNLLADNSVPFNATTSTGIVGSGFTAEQKNAMMAIMNNMKATMTMMQSDPMAGIQLVPSLATALLSLYKTALTSGMTNIKDIWSKLFGAISSSDTSTIRNLVTSIPNSVSTMSKSLASQVKEKLGFGEGELYKQGNDQWANMPIGRLPDGSIATMENAGCGPTAMAAVANRVRLGYGNGPVTPAEMAQYAGANGYISQGGANAGLFTEGAARMGLASTPIADSNQLRANLVAGRPTVLTGAGGGSDDPYTKAGHIVVAEGIAGNKTKILDPMTGKSKTYDIDRVAKKTNHAWAYSAGYGTANNLSATLPAAILPAYSAGSNYNALSSNEREYARKIANGADPNTAIPVMFSDATKERIRLAAYELISKGATTATAAAPVSKGIYASEDFAGLNYDYATIGGYNTGENGLDQTIIDNNYDYFENNDKYYHTMYRDKHLKVITGRGYTDRLGNSHPLSPLKMILNTQYFGLKGGSYGGISITARKNTRGNYASAALGKDDACQYFAAAIVAENNKGTTKITSLSNAERMCAVASAMRIIYGFKNTFNYFAVNLPSIRNTVESIRDADYSDIVKAVTGLSDISDELTEDTGISTPEQLKEIYQTKGLFGKLKLIGFIAQARINAFLNGSSFWEEYKKLTSEEKPTTSGTSTLTGASADLSRMQSNPQNMQEELLAKTLENAYREESGANYAAINRDDKGQPSIGPYQARGENAQLLLKNLANTQGLPSDLKAIFRKYADWTGQGDGPLGDAETAELSGALANSEHADEIKRVIDNTALRHYSNTYYRPYLSKWFDAGDIKDPRTLPMLGDLCTVGYAHVVNTKEGAKYTPTSWKHNWTPTTKEKELEAAYQLLTSNKTFLGSNNIYADRAKRDYNNMKGYTFKTTVNQGEMVPQFAAETNPLGFGPFDQLGDLMAGYNQYGDKGEQWVQDMGEMGTRVGNYLASSTGFSLNDLGVGLDGAATGDIDTSTDDYSYGGSASDDGGVLTSLSGTDRDRFLAAAKSQIGYLEKQSGYNLKSFTGNAGTKNYTKYGKEMGTNPNAWCAYFTSWAGKAAGLPSSQVYRNGSCTNIMEHYKNKGQFFYRGKTTPRPGDIVLFNKSYTPVANPEDATIAGHIGIVESLNGGIVNTIEGNTLVNGTQGVHRRQRPLAENDIIGFARPNWTNTSKTVDPSSLLSLGYGSGKKSSTKIDSPMYQKNLQTAVDTQPDYPISTKELASLGFGPGMKVDAGFDTSSTDSKLDQIFGLVAEWYTESKKVSAAQSSDTKNVNVVNATTNNIKKVDTPAIVSPSKYKDRMVYQHVTLAERNNVRQ